MIDWSLYLGSVIWAVVWVGGIATTVGLFGAWMSIPNQSSPKPWLIAGVVGVIVLLIAVPFANAYIP